MAGKRVGILTGGGDVPGVNYAIKSVVARLEQNGHECIGLRRGWAALLNVIPGDEEHNSRWVVTLDRRNTRTIDRTLGTVLHTSRVNPSIMRPGEIPEHLHAEGSMDERGFFDLTPAALRTLEHLKLDCIVCIGGDGTLTFARRMHEEGVPIIAIPKTMDNDVYGTDYCLGFSTAVTRAVEFIGDLRTSAASHERFLIVELFGRYSGETCLLASLLGDADRALLAEVPFDRNLIFDLLSQDRMANPANYAVLAVSEGAVPVGGRIVESGSPDDYGNPKLGGIGRYLADYFEHRSSERVIYQRLAYLMRSGSPDSLDQLVSNNFGTLAAEMVNDGQFGKMVAILGGRYTAVPIEATGEGIKRVDVDRFYDRENYRPKVQRVLDLPMFLH